MEINVKAILVYLKGDVGRRKTRLTNIHLLCAFRFYQKSVTNTGHYSDAVCQGIQVYDTIFTASVREN